MADAASPVDSRMTLVKWLICTIAAIGFAFDIYELLMLPLIVRPALMELAGVAPGTPEFGMWVGRLFYIPAFVGGIFGLAGGYLTDRLGRRRVLTWSILLYAFSAFAAGYSTNIWMLLFFRCTTFIGVCVEFVAAVAWLAELFPIPHQRERVLGYTQAFSSIGGLLVAFANSLAVDYAAHLPAIGIPDFLAFGGSIGNPHAPWRYTLMSGLIPAIPLVIIRPFLPESPAWKAKKDAGTLKRASLMELFQPRLRRTTLVTAAMFACSYGAAFGAIQMIPQIVPGLPEVKEQIRTQLVEEQSNFETLTDENIEAVVQSERVGPQLAERLGPAVGKVREIKSTTEQKNAANVTKVQEVGGLVGRFLLAILAVQIVSRRWLLRVFQIPGLIIMPVVFAYMAIEGLNLLYFGIFLAGLVTVAQFSFWGNYLPRVYPLHLRGTGESFAANIGGRMIGTSFAALTGWIAVMDWVPGTSAPEKVAYTAAGVALSVYVAGFLFSFIMPEPGIEDMAEDE